MKKRILFINGHLNTGGVERSLVDVLRHLDYERFDVDLMLLEDGGDYLKEVPAEVNTHIYHLNDASGPLLQTLCRLLREAKWQLFFFRIISLLCSFGGNRCLALARPLFREARIYYDTIVAYRPERPTYFAAHMLKGKKKLSWWHHGEVNLTTNQIDNTGKAYNLLDNIVTVSRPCADLLQQVFPDIASKTIVIPNMVCADEIKQKAQQYKVNLQADICNIVSVGRLSTEKNMKMCIEVARVLKDKDFPFHWFIIGDGTERSEIKQLVEEYDMAERVTLTGSLANPYPYMEAANLLVHPSLVESQGLTPLEAMALGTPVVAVKSAGVMEYIQNGKNGTIVNNDQNELATTILNQSEQKHPELPSEFLPETIIQQIESLLER